MDILEKIRDLNKDNLSINKLEQEIGLSRGSMEKWDRHKPKYDKVKKVADYFNVSVDYLMGETDIKEKTAFNENGLDRKMIGMFATLTPEEIVQVDAFVQGLIAARKA